MDVQNGAEKSYFPHGWEEAACTHECLHSKKQLFPDRSSTPCPLAIQLLLVFLAFCAPSLEGLRLCGGEGRLP